MLEGHFPKPLIAACRDAFEPILEAYLRRHRDSPNRGPHRHFLPMPFEPPCFAPEFFFDETILAIVRLMLGNRIVADQWGCDVPLLGSTHQELHKDYQHPLFEEQPDLALPPYMLIVSFPLVDITDENGPIEIAPGPRPVLLKAGDVLIRYPWTLHRGTPNRTSQPRPLCTIRYVRRWYADASRDVSAIPRSTWNSLTDEQRQLLRFPVSL